MTTFSSQKGGISAIFLSAEELPDGRMLFGTGSKVYVYDGEGFSTVSVRDGAHVFSMDRGPDGRIYLGGRSLMGVLQPDSVGELTYHSFVDLLPDSLKDFGRIWDTRVGPDGGVYFRSDKSLFHFDGDTIETLHPYLRFFRLYRIGDRMVVEDGDSGLFQLKGVERSRIPGSGSFAREGVYGIVPEAKEGSDQWVGFSRRSSPFRFDPSTGRVERLWDGAIDGARRKLMEAKLYDVAAIDPDRNPYGAAYVVGTRLDGVFLLDPEGRVVFHLGREEGLPARAVWEVKADDRGNVWVMTNSGLALIHTGRPFTFAEEGSLFQGGFFDIARPSFPDHPPEGKEDHPLFLATAQGAWVWDGAKKRFSLLEGSEGHCLDLVPFQKKDGLQRMLIAGGNAGLLSAHPLDPDKDPPSAVDTLDHGFVFDMAALPYPSYGSVVCGGREGVFVVTPSEEGEHWERVLETYDIPDRIISMSWDTASTSSDSIRLWAGMASKGVLSIMADTGFTGFQMTRYDTTDGLPDGNINAFNDPEYPGVTLISNDEGFYVEDEKGFRRTCRYGEPYCRAGNGSTVIKRGVKGGLWLDNAQKERVEHLKPEGDGYHIDSTTFRVLEHEGVGAIFPDEERVWIGSDLGLACYFPDTEKRIDGAWDCLIREVRGVSDSLLFGGTFMREGEMGSWDRVPLQEQPDHMVPQLPYAKNRKVFEFAAPFPDRQEAVLYQYKLSGFDTTWSKWTHENKKEYTNLPEGAYRFKVKARTVYGHESSTAVYRFRILPPWYRTWWAYGGYSVAGGAFLWLLLWLNGRRLRAQKARLEKIVQDRTREIQEKNKNLEEANRTIQTEKREVEKQKEIVEEAHQEITQSIDYAQKIQYALLQSEEHVSPHLPEHFILFKPQSQVSGDFYWGKEHKGYFYIAAVDCTGHGVPGAFMSMLGISQLNEIMNTDETPTPGEVLTELRDRVVRELSSSDPKSTAKDGMDAALVRIPLGKEQGVRSKEGEGKSVEGEAAYERGHPKGEGFNPPRTEGEDPIQVQFAGAQNPLYVIRKGIAEEPPSASLVYQGEEGDGHVGSDHDPNPINPFKKSSDGIEIKGDGQPVGYDEYAKDAFATVRVQLQKGDVLYIFSDGYADQFGGPKGKKFRYGPFKQLLASVHEKPLEEQKQELDKTFEEWKAESGQEQIDDVVVIGVRL